MGLILGNLVQNALKYAGSEVVIATRLNGAGGATAQEERGWQFYTTDRSAYRRTLDGAVAHSGNSSACLRSQPSTISRSFALLWQRIDASRYRGQRIRLSGYLKTSGVTGWTGLWLRVDPKEGPTLEFENMQQRPVVGTGDWKEYSVELNVAEQAEEIHFGALLVGSGQIWVDDIELLSVGRFVPGAEELRRARNLPFEPLDPGFEIPK
ncbi:hypothetical protein IV102_10145 [bacterium]|nr:hypothetical protein [bacterium]